MLYSILKSRRLMILLVCACVVGANHAVADPTTALEDYVDSPDPAFNFEPVIPPISLPGLTFHVLQVTSQEWRNPDEVDRTLWRHFLTIAVPDTVVSNTSLIFISGGDNDDGIPDLGSDEAEALALFSIASGTVVSIIQQVPNQPLVFADDPSNPRKEDRLVAYTFDKATRTGDYNWPAYLPMVKSAVRAMDVVQTFVPIATEGRVDVTQFVVSGFSKRGVTAWLTAAVDERVAAVAPGVFDVLNFAPSIENHRASYGDFSDALDPFQEFDLLDRVRIPEMRELRKIIDPFSYVDRLTMPKYILNSSGDEFYPPDSSLFYVDALQGETLLRYGPNTNHGGDNGGLETALQGLLAWYQNIISGAQRPEISWTLEEDDTTLRVTASGTPLQALLWEATNPVARDFRFDETGPIWVPTPLLPGDGEFIAQVEPPASGWKAFFMELIFPGVVGLPESYTTSVFIMPQERPFPLDQPINNPRSALFWRLEFAAALGEAPWYNPTFDAETLESFLPVRVFDQFISTLEEGREALKIRRNTNDRALRQCFGVRLNVEAEEIDWYSPSQLFLRGPERFLWKHWNRAHQAFLTGKPLEASFVCTKLNSL